MVQTAKTVVTLSAFDTQALLPLGARAVDTYLVPMRVMGNSLLSSVLVTALDPGAAVQVNYYEQTTGNQVGERRDLPGHVLINTTALSPNTRIVTPFHLSPVMEAVVTGGNATFGVLVTVVDTFASDIDQALKLHLQAVALASDKGLPQVLYDEATGLWHFAKGIAGVQLVQNTDPPAADRVHVDAFDTTTPGAWQTLLDADVPAGKTRHLSRLHVACRVEGTWQLEAGADVVASGRTGAAAPNSPFRWEPARPFGSLTEISLKFRARTGSPAADVEAYLMGHDE